MRQSLSAPPQQTQPFHSIELQRQVSQTVIAEEFCKPVTGTHSSISNSIFYIASHSTVPVLNQVNNTPFSLKE
ncbi:MAG: hypothetical protein O7D30_04410, partial [Rickettsia endosymbiont of Ixodes persulcatus]|nr:hypothetical protein [Rickettsia endosymbiont of Ixodes persulcatus]